MKLNLERLKSILSEHANKFIGGAFAVVIGLFGFYLTPLKDNFFHYLYKEKAEIQIVIAESTHQGETLKLTNIIVTPNSKINIGSGSCKIDFDKEFLILKKGKRVFEFPKIESPKLILDTTGISFMAIKSGNTYVKTIIKTKYNTYRDSVLVSILPIYKSNKPTESDFGGVWNFKLGFHNGTMNLIDNDRSLSGSYLMDNEESGVVNGIYDGFTFKIDLIRKGEMKKWDIDGRWVRNQNFIEINAEGLELVINGNSWKKRDDSTYKFYSSVEMEKNK